jgi:trehalose 6-phosphate phosphatase
MGSAAEWPSLAAFRERLGSAGLFLDFDGTISDIVERPELARPVPGAVQVLRDLSRRAAVVAIVSGRPGDEVGRLLVVDGLAIFGLYGLEGRPADDEATRHARPAVVDAVRDVEGAWVEDKGLSLAVHYRLAPDPAAAQRVLSERLERVALRRGLFVMPGKMVIELAPTTTPGKGSVVLREARARGLTACLYAGDDEADAAAFAALDELSRHGIVTVKVAVRSAEAPPGLIGSSDVVVDRPAGLVELLRSLA